MGLIQRLPEDVVNRMAAGEVLARPFNAIKELVENSLDAGATEIMVNMQAGGLKLIQVNDNGKGIERDDFELVCERFATSKLAKFEDLMHMKTYGFRGEALASLSHVAKVNIVSKRETGSCAYQADYLDGKMISASRPAAGKQGTCVTATELFYNLPTRRNKMATHGEEAKMVYDTLLRFAVHRPDVSFALRQNQSSDFRTKGDGNLRDVVSNLLGREIADTLTPLNYTSSRLKFQFSGHFSKPIASSTAKTAMSRKTSRSFFSVFINGRSVRGDILKTPLEDVLQNRSLLCQFCHVHLEIDETRIDVNVHPTKSSVIFLEKEEIVAEIRDYFETIVAEMFGFEKRDKEVEVEEEENVNQTTLMFSQMPIKSIEAIRRPSIASTSSEPSFRIPSKGEKKRVDHMEVRTDSKERKLDEFLVRCHLPTEKSTSLVVDSQSDVERYAELDEVSMVSVASSVDRDESQDLGDDEQHDLETATTHREFQFSSLESLRHKIVSESSNSLRELFKTCTFVGSVDPEKVLIQYGTSLYLIDFCAVLREFFYQISIFSFGNFGSYRLESEPPSVIEMLELLAELGENDENYKDFRVFCQPANREKAQKLLGDHSELLHDYFAIRFEWIDDRLHLTEIPSLVHYYVPQLEKLPFLIAALIMEVDYDDESQCFSSVSRALGDLFTLQSGFVTAEKLVSSFSSMKWKPLIKQILMPLVKRKFIPPDSFRNGDVIKQLADSHDLYKVFERCGS